MPNADDKRFRVAKFQGAQHARCDHGARCLRQSHLMGEQRQTRMKIGVVANDFEPALDKIGPLIPVSRKWVCVDAPGQRTAYE